MDKPRLQVLILGSPLITWDGEPLRIARLQIRSLIYYLAIQSQPVPRSRICQLFWPNTEDEKARKLLREALSKLRAALPDPSTLLAFSGEVILDPQKVYVDAREYKKLTDPLLESAEINRDAVLPAWMYSEMRKAISICRGNIKLDDVKGQVSGGFEDFLNFASQSYDYTRLRMEERLASHCIAVGDLDEAILWLGKALEIDPYNDDNNFLVINCLKDSGRARDALDFIVNLENLYKHTLDQQLPATIKSLQKRIGESHESEKEDLFDWPGMEKKPVPFVGRSDLLEKLRNAYTRKGIVSVRGPSGIGKNSLVREFYLNLPRKPRLVFCTGKPMVRCSPLEPLIEGIRAAVKPEEWLELPAEHQKPLKLLFPELSNDAIPSQWSNHEGDTVEDFLRICEALNQLLILLARKRPLLLVMDIIVWTDEASIEFLSYLSDRDFYKKYGLLVLISRKEESNSSFEVFVDRNVMLRVLEKIDIQPLTMEESTLLIIKMLGRDPSREFLERFYHQTGGNPYFIVEGLKSLVTINFDFQEFDSTSLYPIPDTIIALINEKLLSLPESAVKILQAGSVLGQFFQAEVVEAMVDMETTTMITALEELEKFCLISVRKSADGDAGYFFDHNQVREVVLQELSPLRKRHLHLAAVNALIKVFGHKPDLASIFAYHYEEAGEPVKAFEAWLMAAEFARMRFSKSDRYYAYERAFALINKLPQELLVENVDNLVTNWGNYAIDLSDTSTCLKIYNMCLEIGEKTQNPILLSDAWNGLSRAHEMELEIEEGIDAANRAQFYCDRIDHLSLKLETLARLAILYYSKNEIQKSIEFCEKAMTYQNLVKTQREMDALVVIEVQLGLMYIVSGWPKKTIELGEKAINLSLLIKRRSAKVQAAVVLAAGYFYVGEYQKSLQNALTAHPLAEKLNYRWWLSFLEAIMGRDYLGLGNIDKSWSYCQSAMDREKPFENGGVYALTCSLAGEIYRLYGDNKNALLMYKRGMSIEEKNYQTMDCAVLFAITGGAANPIQGLRLLDDLIAQGEKFGMAPITLSARLGKYLLTGLVDPAKVRDAEIDEQIGEMVERGFATSPYVGDLFKAIVAKTAGNNEKASLHYKRLIDGGKNLANVWIKLAGVSGLMTLVEAGDEKAKLKKELAEMLSQISEKSKQPLLQRMFYIYRKKTLGKV